MVIFVLLYLQVVDWLDKAPSRFHYVNVQGPGFDDQNKYKADARTREYSPKLEREALKWYNKLFPTCLLYTSDAADE